MDDEPTGGISSAKQYQDAQAVGAANYCVYWTTRILRAAMVICSLLVIIAYGCIMKQSSESKGLTVVGHTFVGIAAFGSILLMAILLVVQFEIEFFMKYFRFFDYWPVRSGALFFMGCQILISKNSFSIQGLNNTFQDATLATTGYVLVLGSLVLTIMSLIGARKYDHLGTGPKDLNANTVSALPTDHPKSPSSPTKAGFTGGSAPLIDEAVPYGHAGLGPGTSAYGGGIQSDGLGAEVSYVPPVAQAPRGSPTQPTPGGDPWAKQEASGAASDPFGSGRVNAAQDDDIARRRQAEDDELERLYQSAPKKPAPKASGGGADGFPDDPFGTAS